MSRSSVELVRTEGVVVAADAGAVVVAADGSRRLLQVGDTVHPGDLVFTGGKPLIIDFGDDPVAVASNCATCVDGANGTLVAASAETLDVDALQQAILAGVDPTQAFEAAAAGPGGGVGGSGGSSFSVITRDGAATLAEAGFDTSTTEAAEPVVVNEVVTAPAQTTPEPLPNTPPSASDLNLTVNEDEVLNGAIVASDLDGDALSYALGTGPANGAVTLNADGTFTYTPNANYNGSDSFTVTVSDGQGGTVTSTVTIGVTPVNDAPTTSNVSLTTAEDTAVSGAVTGADLDGDALSYALGTGPANGGVTLNADGTFTYTPNANYNGSDSFTVTVSDGQGGTVTSTVTIGVTPVNDAPTTSNVSLTTAEDTAVSGAVTGADLDGDALSFALGTSPTNGSVVLNADGTFTYTPNANYNGSDSFTVTVSDGNGGTAISTVTIGVTPANDPTVVANDAVSTNEDTAIDINVLANDSDIDGPVSPVASVTQGAHGTVTINLDGTVKYTPNANFSGDDSFTYTNAEGNTATVNVTVHPVNDAPQVNAGQLFGYSENMAAGDTVAQVTASDVDSSVTAFRFADTGTTISADGWFQISNSGVISLTAAGAASAANDFESGGNSHTYAIQAGDGAGAWSPAVNVTLQELNRNDGAGLKGEYWAYEQTTGMTPKDGPNLTNLAQVEAFMANRTASATFVATTVNYGQVGGNLGAEGKLQTFLGADAGSLSVDPVNSSDAMIRLTGQIDLAAGDYEFRVRADDGFSIRIDGVVVAEVNANQSPTTTTFPSFTISEGGAHTIEIIYWDQAGNAVLQPELRPVGGTYQPLGGLIVQQTEDSLVGSDAQDQLYAGRGNDSLLGGAGADTFIWKEGDEGTAAKPAADRVGDFAVADGDRLDLSDLLQGETLGTIDQYLGVAFSGDDTVLSVSTTAGGSVTQTITLEGWSKSDWQNAYGGDASLDAGNLVQKLIDDGKLQIS